MESPSFPGSSHQQLEVAEDRRTTVTIEPIPSFALGFDRSESSEASERKIVHRHQDPSPQHTNSPFGWFGDHLSHYQNPTTVTCRICNQPQGKRWWSIFLLESCARAGCERCVIRLLALLEIIQRDKIGPDMQYSQLQFRNSIIKLNFSSGLQGLDKHNNNTPFFPWSSRTVKIELYTSLETRALGWYPLIGVGRDVMQDRRTQCSRLIIA
jgi:hypothetical protein